VALSFSLCLSSRALLQKSMSQRSKKFEIAAWRLLLLLHGLDRKYHAAAKHFKDAHALYLNLLGHNNSNTLTWNCRALVPLLHYIHTHLAEHLRDADFHPRSSFQSGCSPAGHLMLMTFCKKECRRGHIKICTRPSIIFKCAPNGIVARIVCKLVYSCCQFEQF
jgi:hypothetical protein